MRHTRFAALIDPDPTKQISVQSLKILAENVDIILHGGTPNETLTEDEESYTLRSMDKVKSVITDGVPPIYIFPGSPSQVVPGAYRVLYLFIPNSTDTFFGWGVQTMSIDDVLEDYPMKKLKSMMYLSRGGKVGEFAKIDQDWRVSDFEKAAKITNLLGFESLYLDGGSGGKAVDVEIVKKVSKILDSGKELFVGGGINSVEKVKELIGLVDVIVIGTALEKNPKFAINVRKILDESQRRS